MSTLKAWMRVTRFSVGVPRNDIYEEVLIRLGFEKGGEPDGIHL